MSAQNVMRHLYVRAVCTHINYSTLAKSHPKCDKAFTLKKNLKRHEFIHSGERTHTCSKYGKAFSLQHNLKNHELIHTVEKPHVY